MENYQREYEEEKVEREFVFDGCCLDGAFVPAEGGDGKATIIGIAGGPGMTKESLSILSQFSSLGYDVCLYDAHNVGGSEGHPEPYQFETFHRGLEAVMEDFEEVILFGHSWGSMFILEYMTDRFEEGLVETDVIGLILTAPLFDTQKNIEIAKTLRMQALSPVEMNELVSLESEKAFDSQRYEKLEGKVENQFSFKGEVPEFLNEVFSELNEKMYTQMWGPSEFTLSEGSVLDSLSELTVPVYLVSGEDDLFGVHDLFIAQEKIGENCSVEIVEGASHTLMWERPEHFIKIVSDWLESQDWETD